MVVRNQRGRLGKMGTGGGKWEMSYSAAQNLAANQYILKGGLVVNSFVKHACYLL